MKNTVLNLRDLHFAHGDRAVLDRVELDVPTGEVLVIVGASGCGKTTLLRCIAGLERASAGRITLADQVLDEGRTHVAPEQRSIGFVFQGLALFPHLTVDGNVAFGLHGMPKAERAQRVKDELAAVGLEGLGDRYPHQLSGGQQQRVAIARSLVRRPKLMLMDEPFSDLDPATRKSVRAEVLRILRAHGTTAIIVTHDREDAFHVADRIAEMDRGRIVRIERAEVFRAEWSAHPHTP
ncbi:MAG: ABC transporter ATP-binding protein [Flavobacteriales bacterium]|nr:ABC transporter ATP-binding protein [Flavobacteriales bacterium]